MKRAILFFVIMNIIVVGLLNVWPLKAIDVAQRKGRPPFKDHVQNGKIQTTSHNKVLTQTFLPKAKSLSGVGFYSKPFPSSINEVFVLSIKQHNKALRQVEIKTGEIRPGLNIINFKPLELNKERYAIEFKTDKSNKHYLSVWRSNTNVYKDGRMLINGREKNMDIVFQTYLRMSPMRIIENTVSPDPPLWPMLFLILFFEILIFAAAWVLDMILGLDLSPHQA